jgi:outer membrane protein
MKSLILFLFLSPVYGSIIVNEKKLEKELQSSPELQENLRRFESASKLKGHLLRSFLPNLGLTYGQEKFTTGPYEGVVQPYGGIKAKINLFNSGRDRLEAERINLEAQAANVEVKIVQAKILAELRKSLAHFAYLSEIELILNEALKLTEVSGKDALKRTNAGLATKTDLLDFKQQSIQLNQELQKLRFEKGVTKRMVATLLGHSPDEDLEIRHQNAHPEHGQEQKLKLPVDRNLLIRKAKILTEVSQIESSKAQRWWGPEVELYGYAMRFTQKEREYPEGDQRNDVTIGIKIELPLFDGGHGVAETRAKSMLVKAQSQKLYAQKLEVKRDTLDARMKLDDLIHGAEENVKIMEKYRQGIKSEYSKGVKNSPDVLQATQRWISAREKFAEVKKNYQFAKADALFLLNLSGD